MKRPLPHTATTRHPHPAPRGPIEPASPRFIELDDEALARVTGGVAPDVTTHCNDVNCD
jgi:hypothetical protein